MPVLKVKNNGEWQDTFGISSHTHRTDDITNFPDSLPSPNKLIIEGAVSAEYDGSEEIRVNIPVAGVLYVKVTIDDDGMASLVDVTAARVIDAVDNGIEVCLCATTSADEVHYYRANKRNSELSKDRIDFVYRNFAEIDIITISRDGLIGRGVLTLSAEDVGADVSGTADNVVTTHNSSTNAHDDIRSQIRQLSSEKVDMSQLSLGIASDGLMYVFINGNPVGTGIARGTGDDVFGYVDENNTVVLSGNLPNGAYTIKYEMEDGSLIDIGNLTLDNNVYYSVKNNLTNCINENGVTKIIKNGTYAATIMANSGYELSSVAVTMGGTDITADSVSGGNINIANVTDNIVITAVATEVQTGPAYTNQIPISTDVSGNPFNGGQGWKTDARMSLSGGGETTSNATDYECTGFIQATKADTIRIKNIDLTEESATNIVCFDSDKQPIAVNTAQYGTTLYALFVQYGTKSGDVYTSKLSNVPFLTYPKEVAFIRIGSKSITADSILTINEEIV